MATYTYTEPVGGVFADPVSEVRFKLGDTTPAPPFSLSDAEIEYLLVQNDGNVVNAAADVAYKMGGRYTAKSSETSRSIGNLSITKAYSDSADRYFALANSLRRGADVGSNSAPSGPLYDDSYQPQFYLGQFDNKGYW